MRRPGGTPATVALARAGVEHEVLTYSADPRAASYGLEAAAALGVDPGRVFKTLVASVDARLVVALVPVDTTVDLKALAAAVGAKRAELAEPAAAERATGYVVGGISPLGQRTRLPTVIDDSALTFATVLVSGGRRGLEIALAPSDLVALTGAGVARLRRRA